MLLHLSTRPPTTRPRSPNPQPHTALVSFPSAEFCSRFSPCVRLFLGLLHQNTEKENCSVICFLFLADMLHLPCRSRELTFVCGVPTRARLVTWWHEWAPLLAAAGPCLYTPSGSVDLCQLPLYLLPSTVPPPPPAPCILLHPPTASNSDWAPLCVMWAHTDAASVSVSKGPTVNTGYIFRNMSCEIFSRALMGPLAGCVSGEDK